MARRIIIAGGSGTIGRELAASLLDAGDDVAVLTRDPARAARRLPTAARAVRWSVEATAELSGVLADSAAVVNLAGVPIGPLPWTRGRKQAIRESRLRATGAIVDAIARLPAARRPLTLVSASGTDVYAGLDEAEATESTPPAQDFLSRVCLDWEAAARGAEALGVRVVIVRQAFVLARGAPVLSLLALPFRLFLGGPLGSGRQWFSWIHVADLAALYERAIGSSDMSGIYNAASRTPCRNVELAVALGRALGRPSWLRVPGPLIRLALGEESTLVLDSRRAVPARALELGFTFRHPDLEAALRDALAGSPAR